MIKNNIMKKVVYSLLTLIALSFAVNSLKAREIMDFKSTKRVAAGSVGDCDPTQTQTDLDIGNVRATLLVGGDMWWDLKSAKYEVPKVTNPSDKRFSIFAGSLWIGGIDGTGQLKVAAQTYRQTGNDFFAGAVDTVNLSIGKADCKKWDRHYKINKSDVQNFVKNGVRNSTIDSWPGNGDPSLNEARFLAPFYDANQNGKYEPDNLDEYPKFNLTNVPLCDKNLLKGDQAIWWVFNDLGNGHSESKGVAIGLEIQAQAFAFSTSSDDPIGTCTFYQYKIINRSSTKIDSTFFGQWVDSDLGYAFDDYVGCDVTRGLGYTYNGEANDPGPTGYGLNPPALGVDFFEGPYANIGDGKDNDRDGCVDCTFKDSAGVRKSIPDTRLKEQIIMSKFVYYNNDATVQGNPDKAKDYYNYLNGVWRDNVRFTYGGNGKGGGNGATGTQCDFMFPGDSDPVGFGTGGTPTNPKPRALWTEGTAGNVPFDRRFIQSAGPFTLQPGGINYITTGVVWSRASSGGPLASVAELRSTDDNAQALFKSCFNIVNGPDAPTVSIRELDKEVIISISNDSTSNNYKEKYSEIDPFTNASTSYLFQGYQIIQVKNEVVAGSIYSNVTHELDNNNARVVAQCDIVDDVFKPVSFFKTQEGNWIPARLITEGQVVPYNVNNTGIVHSFRITKDLFSNDGKITNNKKLYYLVIAYGVNKSSEEITTDPYNTNNPSTHYKPYIASRRGPGGFGSVPLYQVVPHIPSAENGGTNLNSTYGSAPEVTRLQGQGNGGNSLDLTQASIDNIINTGSGDVVYKPGNSPIAIKVIDPVKVKKADFKLTFLGSTITDTTHWKLTNSLNDSVYVSDGTISSGTEDIIKSKWGFSVSIKKVIGPGIDLVNNKNAFNGGTVTFLPDTANVWFRNIADFDSIRTAKARDMASVNLKNSIQTFGGYTVSDWIIDPKDALSSKSDSNGYYNKILPNTRFSEITQITPGKTTGGTWAPFIFTSSDPAGPNYKDILISQASSIPAFKNISSVLLVITPDKSKWTRSAVVEETDTAAQAEGGATKLGLRAHPSINKDGSPDNSGTTGMGWFPGYAFNLETGERLNIIYGEASSYTGDNGNDLLWNPTSTTVVPNTAFGERFFGGRHYIYIMAHNSTVGVPAYDEGQFIYNTLKTGNKTKVFKDAMWVGMPILSAGKSMTDGVPLSEVRININVNKPYLNTQNVSSPSTANPSYSFSTRNLAAEINNLSTAKKSLDLIKVVPNPYYAYSEYETSQFDNKIKITNLPNICTVSIYTVNGTLVRTLTKDTKNSPYNNGDSSLGSSTTDRNTAFDSAIDWDLKNSYGIPIASGAYIIHIKADGIGEKIIKWFGVLRPLDLSNY
jgi:hypothetical protein